MPYVNEIAVVCMNKECAFYHAPTLRSFDPTVALLGNRVRCNKCAKFTGVIVRETAEFYRDIRIQDPYLDERGDASGYNLLPIDDITTYPIRSMPPFEMFPVTLVRPTAVRPPVVIPDPCRLLPPPPPRLSSYRFPPPRKEDFGAMMDAFRIQPPNFGGKPPKST